MRFLLLMLTALCCLAGCGGKKADPALLTDPEVLHRNMDAVTQVIIHDVFSPPVASRIYAYTSLAAYEALRFDGGAPEPSIAAQLNGFPALPQPERGKAYNYLLAATKALFTVAEKVTFSRDTLLSYQQRVYKDYATLMDEETYQRSLAFGEAIGQKILERSQKDHYKETRGLAKFLGSNDPGMWRPTPPDYMDAAEPWWNQIQPLAIDSAGQFKCPPPPVYSTDSTSPFYKLASEVFVMSKNLTPEQREIARYWDDNPFVLEHAGHTTYANKKITPVGHWIGITTIACRQKGLKPAEAAQAYVMTATAIFDAFISCWAEKYRTQVVRPVTVINELIDRNWTPFLQTPPFPEYTSGHSGISAAAATVLTQRFGEDFAFEDTSDLKYIGMKRKFPSFRHAAQEASISRVYGGIHYRTGVDAGAEQGNHIGSYILEKIRL